MGYKYSPKVQRIRFDETHEFAGLEMTVRSMPMGKFLRLLKMAEMRSQTPTAEDLEQTNDFFNLFGQNLVSWNMTDEEDNPVPATPDGVATLDFPFVTRLVMEYIDAVAGVATPLGGNSNSGATSQAPSIPMEAL